MNFFYPSKSRLGKKEFLLCHGQKHILPVLDQHAKFDLNIKLELKFFFFFFFQYNSIQLWSSFLLPKFLSSSMMLFLREDVKPLETMVLYL